MRHSLPGRFALTVVVACLLSACGSDPLRPTEPPDITGGGAETVGAATTVRATVARQDDVPLLIAPASGAILDNGCSGAGTSNPMVWRFEWSPVPAADAYELLVRHHTSALPIIDVVVTRTSYRKERTPAWIADVNRLDWRWKVRARSDQRWGPWSEERSFDVEPLNTDCQ